MVREAGKLKLWEVVASVFEVDQNWNQLDPRKQFIFSEQILQYFYYLVFDLKGASCFTLSKFFSNKDLLQYFPQHLLLGQVIFKYILYHIYFLLLPTGFIYIKSFFIKTFKIKRFSKIYTFKKKDYIGQGSIGYGSL